MTSDYCFVCWVWSRANTHTMHWNFTAVLQWSGALYLKAVIAQMKCLHMKASLLFLHLEMYSIYTISIKTRPVISITYLLSANSAWLKQEGHWLLCLQVHLFENHACLQPKTELLLEMRTQTQLAKQSNQYQFTCHIILCLRSTLHVKAA